jgi:hypothetical protein
MAVTVPDHDTLIKHIQNLVIEAVDKEGWPHMREMCEIYGISPTHLRKIYLWESENKQSFNFQKLIDAYDLAYDVVHDRKLKTVAYM